MSDYHAEFTHNDDERWSVRDRDHGLPFAEVWDREVLIAFAERELLPSVTVLVDAANGSERARAKGHAQGAADTRQAILDAIEPLHAAAKRRFDSPLGRSVFVQGGDIGRCAALDEVVRLVAAAS